MRYANKVNLNHYDFPTLCGWMVSTGKYGEGKPINNSKGLVEQMAIAKKSGILDYTPVAIRLEPDYYCYSNHGDTQQGWWDDHHWAKYHALTPPYETFDKFCKKISSLGGIPFTYFQSNMPSKDFAMTHPDWMLNNDISRLHAEHPHHMPFVKFDYTDPGFQEYTVKMWQRLAREGMKGIKFDYSNPPGARTVASKTNPSPPLPLIVRFSISPAKVSAKAPTFTNVISVNTAHHDSTSPPASPTCNASGATPPTSNPRWLPVSAYVGSRTAPSSVTTRMVNRSKIPKTKKPHTSLHRRTMLTLVGLISGRIELGTSFGSTDS